MDDYNIFFFPSTCQIRINLLYDLYSYNIILKEKNMPRILVVEDEQNLAILYKKEFIEDGYDFIS